MAWWMVTQQCWLSGQEMPVAPVSVAGNAPSCTQDGRAGDETSATVPVAEIPMATQRWLVWQLTAVTSRMPAGRVAAAHVVPPSEVEMMVPWPLEVWLTWPTAVQWWRSLQEMAER